MERPNYQKFNENLTTYQNYFVAKAMLEHKEQLTGWQIVDNVTDYVIPTPEQFAHLEELQGWALPQDFKDFFYVFGRGDTNEDTRMICRTPDGQVIKLSYFYSIIEMIPPEFDDDKQVRFVTANWRDKIYGENLNIKPDGSVYFTELSSMKRFHKIADSFSEFLEKVEFEPDIRPNL